MITALTHLTFPYIWLSCPAISKYQESFLLSALSQGQLALWQSKLTTGAASAADSEPDILAAQGNAASVWCWLGSTASFVQKNVLYSLSGSLDVAWLQIKEMGIILVL